MDCLRYENFERCFRPFRTSFLYSLQYSTLTKHRRKMSSLWHVFIGFIGKTTRDHTAGCSIIIACSNVENKSALLWHCLSDVRVEVYHRVETGKRMPAMAVTRTNIASSNKINFHSILGNILGFFVIRYLSTIFHKTNFFFISKIFNYFEISPIFLL